jgi:hypothetical protein
VIPFALTNDAVGDLSTNHTEVWVKELDPSTSGIKNKNIFLHYQNSSKYNRKMAESDAKQ